MLLGRHIRQGQDLIKGQVVGPLVLGCDCLDTLPYPRRPQGSSALVSPGLAFTGPSLCLFVGARDCHFVQMERLRFRRVPAGGNTGPGWDWACWVLLSPATPI